MLLVRSIVVQIRVFYFVFCCSDLDLLVSSIRTVMSFRDICTICLDWNRHNLEFIEKCRLLV
jgi:hypothetical protein